MFFLEDRDAEASADVKNVKRQQGRGVHSKEEGKKAEICAVKKEQIETYNLTKPKMQSLFRVWADKLPAFPARRKKQTDVLSRMEAGDGNTVPAMIMDKKENWKKRIWRELKPQLFAGALSLVLVVGMCVGVNAGDFKLGYEAIVDGETLGLITDTQQVEEAISLVRDEIHEHADANAVFDKDPVYIRRLVSGNELTSVEEMKKKLLANVSYMVECYGIYIDGTAQAGLTTEEAANWVLEQYKAKYTDADMSDDATVEFCEAVETKQDFLHIGMLQTPEEALAMLDGAVTAEAVPYTTVEGDTLEGISLAYQVPVEKIKEMNPGVADTPAAGTQLTLEQTVPLLTVKTVQTVELTETIPREVQQVEDDTIYEDTTVVAQEGEDGEAKVLAKITKLNGKEQNREVLAMETVKEPVAKIEKIGTKELPPTTGTGSFLKPAVGSLSSRYGSRWGRSHNGIDIAGATNSDVCAADGGVVTYAGWMDGYGNYIVIDHENGYETAYGHNNSLLVEVGDRVAKGQVIAKMGSTGRSTGTHVHFEVKKDGVFQDPLDFVSY